MYRDERIVSYKRNSKERFDDMIEATFSDTKGYSSYKEYKEDVLDFTSKNVF